MTPQERKIDLPSTIDPHKPVKVFTHVDDWNLIMREVDAWLHQHLDNQRILYLSSLRLSRVSAGGYWIEISILSILM